MRQLELFSIPFGLGFHDLFESDHALQILMYFQQSCIKLGEIIENRILVSQIVLPQVVTFFAVSQTYALPT